MQRGKQCLAALSPDDNLAQDLDHLTVRTSSSQPPNHSFFQLCPNEKLTKRIILKSEFNYRK